MCTQIIGATDFVDSYYFPVIFSLNILIVLQSVDSVTNLAAGLARFPVLPDNTFGWQTYCSTPGLDWNTL